MQYVQVPGIDTIWHQIWKDTVSDFPRLASSASHVYGQPRAFTESFAAYRPEPDVDMARYILNEQFVRGVNLVETMYFPATQGGRGAGRRIWRTRPIRRCSTYVQRMSYLMSMGRPAASVALYLPSSSMWMGDAAADTAFVSTERMLSERQIDFDIVSEDALARDLKAGHGTFETMSGNEYRVVILPGEVVLSQAALDRLREFAVGGGEVLFLGHLPTMISGRTFLDARAATPADFLWAKVEVSAQLEATPTPPAEPPAAPPAAQVVPAAIDVAVREVVGHPDITVDGAETSLRYMKRRIADSDVFLFFNEGAQAISRDVTLHGDGQLVEEWDPATGKVLSVPARRETNEMSVRLELKPYETRVLMVR